MHIQTERLELKPIAPDSLDTLAELLTDDIVKQTYMVPDFSCVAEAIPLAKRLTALSEQDQPLVVGIYAGPELVGILNETESNEHYIELGYALLPQYHNRGFATEALQGAVSYCFVRGFREVRAGAFEDNPASIRVMEKSGMRKLPLTEEISYRGKIHTCVYYAIQKEHVHDI